MNEYTSPDHHWGKLKLTISREMGADNLQEALMFVDKRLSASVREKIQDASTFINILEDHGLISEDDTRYLLFILHEIDMKSAIDIVKKYEAAYKEHARKVERLTGYHDPFFVGREREIDQCVKFLKDPENAQVRCIVICGMTGLGKSKLAAEVCASYATSQGLDRESMPIVRLQKVTTTQEMGVKILHALGLDIPFDVYDDDILFEKIMQRRQDTILLLDNADEILSPQSYSKDHFMNQLSALVGCVNRFMKVIVTSRFSVNFPALKKKPGFLEVELRPLTEIEAIKLLRKMTKPISVSGGISSAPNYLPLNEQYSKAIVEMCGSSPTLLRAVASRIRSGVSPDNILTLLQKPHLAPFALQPSQASEFDSGYYGDNADQVHRLRMMIDELPHHLKDTLVKLSVLPSAFSSTQTSWVLQEEDLNALLLTELRQWSMLESSRSELFEDTDSSEAWYSMHPLVRTACFQESLQVEASREQFHNAVNNFSESMVQIVEKIAEESDADALTGIKKFEKFRTNIMHYLDLEAGENLQEGNKPLISGKLLPAPTYNLSVVTQQKLYNMLDKFLDPSKRRKFFQRKAVAAEKLGDPIKNAMFLAWACDQDVTMRECQAAIRTLQKPIEVLSAMPKTVDSKLALAQCLFVKGRALFNLTDGRYREALKALEEAYEIQKSLKGDDTITARTLNVIGSAHFKSEKYQEALEYHMKAWEMLDQITKGQPQNHVDATVVVMNIGTCYYCAGNEWMNQKNKQKAMMNYEQSIKYYDRALAIQLSLGLTETNYIAQITKNKATTLIEMDKLDEALKLAADALRIRADLSERHPETVRYKSDAARSYYQVGLVYYEMGRKKQKKKEPIETIIDYIDAETYFKKSLQLNLQLGYANRCPDYKDLKVDLMDLASRIHGLNEKERYSTLFSSFEVGVADIPTALDNLDHAGTSIGELPQILPPAKSRCVMS